MHSADRGNVYFWPGSATGPHQVPDVSNPGYANDIGTWYVGDFNGDGYTDLVHSADRGNVYFWPGSGHRSAPGPRVRTLGTQMTSVPGMAATWRHRGPEPHGLRM